MDTLGFLQKVLPTTGVFVAITINGGNVKQGFFKSVEDLAKSVTMLDARGNNTYFALSAFHMKGSRKKDNVLATKVVALDVDCGEGKPFADYKAGLVALLKFIKDMSLPRPMIVFSGNGLHVYWVLTEALAPAEWTPLAAGMKAAAIAQGFEIDPAVPADSARVLRPVGTTNPKGGKKVRLLVDAEPVTPELLASRLHKYVDTALVSGEATNSKLLDALAVRQDFPPAVAAVLEEKCPQIGWAVANQAEVPEPMWYGLMGVAAFCTTPEETAVAWSKDHPNYSEAITLRKMRQWQKNATGPTTCMKFDAERPNVCKDCKFNGKIGTPARLGVRYEAAGAPVNAPDSSVYEVPMPKAFKRTSDGSMKMTLDGTDIDICGFTIYPTSYGKDETLGYEVARFLWDRPHMGWQELKLRHAHLTDKHREFPTALADQGIVLHDKRQTEYFQMMLRSYLENLKQQRAMTNLYATMGWKDNFTQFVMGDTLYRRNDDGSVSEETIALASGTQRLSENLYGKAGSKDLWVNSTALLERANMPWHMFALGAGLSSILYAFSGLKGLTLSLYGPTGCGKTLIQYWIQSAFGDPMKLHFTAKFTQNSLFSRLGFYCHLPMTIDEATMFQDKEIADFLYWVSQGRDKARLSRSAEEREAREWSNITVVSTNKSLQSGLISSGLETQAVMARLFEISMPQHHMFTQGSDAGRLIYRMLTTNYGWIGPEFIKLLLRLGRDNVRALVDAASKQLSKEYGSKFGGEERYQEQCIAFANLTLKLLHEQGLIAFNPRSGIEWALTQLDSTRASAENSKVDAYDLLFDYMNDTADATVRVMHTGVQPPMIDHTRMPRGGIRIRIDANRAKPADKFSTGTMLIDRAHFRKWLSVKGGDYKTFVAELQANGADATPKSQKGSLGRDTPIKLPQGYVVGISLSDPRMQPVLDDMDQVAEDLLLGQLAVVKNT